MRTAAEGATEEQLTLDVNRLIAQWADISAQLEKVQAPALLHSEPDLLIKIVRDVFNEDFQKMVIEGDDARETIERYLRARGARPARARRGVRRASATRSTSSASASRSRRRSTARSGCPPAARSSSTAPRR